MGDPVIYRPSTCDPVIYRPSKCNPVLHRPSTCLAMHRTRRLVLHHITGPATKVLAKGDPGLRPQHAASRLQQRPPDYHKAAAGDPDRAGDQLASQPGHGSRALQLSTTHSSTHPLSSSSTHSLPPWPSSHLTKSSRGNPVNSSNQGGSKPPGR
uniref:Uncharacterized protein n=1 Tax=Tanacetum cinerariifolium TaxID=118510 RepID=A0A699RZT5_TANCI|nr:hypothetical protein [Tanacetum cinerariifolium]